VALLVFKNPGRCLLDGALAWRIDWMMFFIRLSVWYFPNLLGGMWGGCVKAARLLLVNAYRILYGRILIGNAKACAAVPKNVRAKRARLLKGVVANGASGFLRSN
jgi:hypothetical protein